MNSRAHTLSVFEVIKETADAVTLVFDVPAELAERFGYSPGQFLTVEVPSERCGSVARCYSLSSSPHCDRRPAVTVKRTADGYASNWICDNAAVNSVLTVLEPAGAFVPGSLDRDVLLCAAGSGITPVISIAKSVLLAGTGNVALLYANRDIGSVIFAGQIDALAAKFPDRLHVLHWLEEERGLPATDAIAQLVQSYVDRDVYLCGPAGFATQTMAALIRLGVADDRIRTEAYRSLEANPFLAPSAALRASNPNSATIATVELDGQTYELDWPKGTPLLDILLTKGLDAPYVCRESACGTCVCSVRSGRTRMLLNESLLDEELEVGLTLACQTLPESDRVHIAFDQ
ncbi:ferredoxin--NADP reductase [Mycolicibacterium komossense]|uniref:Ferredoxin--NADP reductase n=1 Tax=Mycolicibacterium komossense TaxID=1779 RepID=A0ABT3CFU9_9MYCO|nr:ferredoxin--NADP reductase [Mycolicibacterium komossense]MCV7228377.1 ferredoxin--NADP reductase [Mycolicibacterium komossense]